MIEKLFPEPFLKNQNWAYLWINILKFDIFYSYFCQVDDYRRWLKLSCRPLAFTSNKAFLKNKKRSGTSLHASLSAWFWKKNISVVIFYYLTKFQCLVVFASWYIGQYVYCNCFDVKTVEVNLIFLMKPFLLHDQKVKTKINYLESEKSF